MVLLIKNDNLTDEEFTRYWLHIHAPLVKKMPGVRKYVVNVVKKPLNREPDYHSELHYSGTARSRESERQDYPQR